LTAIELRHRRHQHPLGASALGEGEAFVERQYRVVPGKLFGFRGSDPGRRRFVVDRHRPAKQTGKVPVEPRALAG
jgi:hypothetical protein